MKFNFIKTKKFWFIAIIILMVAWISYGYYKKKNAPIQYETAKVERGNLVQTVEATGKIQSANDLQLRFETVGTLGEIKVKEGDIVKQGQLLASLRALELDASVAQAQANLNQKIAGANSSERSYYEAAVSSAKADWDRTKADSLNSLATANSAVETAKNNLKLAEGGDNSQIVSSEYNDAISTLQSALSKLDDGLTQADNILGIDNAIANDSFESYLSILDTSKLIKAKSNYNEAKFARNQARDIISSLNTISSHQLVDQALNVAENSLSKMNMLLTSVSEVLEATAPVSESDQSSIDLKKTTIATIRNSVIAQYNSVISEKQAISDAKNSYNTYLVAYNKALNDLENAKTTASSVVAIKEAQYNQALANYNDKINPPREVDLAPLRAVLAQALANRDKAILRAPMDGVIAKVNKKVGEMVSSADATIEMISPHYEIQVDIPETDVSKLLVGNSSTITLDAFGDDVKFSGKIISIDPASTEIQDVVYYKVKVALDETDKLIKSGMTANVTVNTAFKENVLFVPTRSVLSGASGKYVRVLKDNKISEVVVKTGLKGDDGKIEILEGVSEGEIIVLSVPTKN